MLKYYLDKTGKVIKSILFPSSEFVDTEPREGSLNPLASGAVANIMPQDATKENPLMTTEDTERMIDAMKPIDAMTLRFEFSKKDYNPNTAGVGSAGTWTKVDSPTLNIWDWKNTNTDWHESFKGAFPDADNEVSVIASGDTSSVTDIGKMFAGVYPGNPDDSNYSLTTRNNIISCVPFDVSNCTNFLQCFCGSCLKKVVKFHYNNSLTYSSAGLRGLFADTYIVDADIDLYGIVSGAGTIFCKCSRLNSVSLKGVENINNFIGVFNGCREGLNDVIVEGELTNCTTIQAFMQNAYNVTKVRINAPKDGLNCQVAFNGCRKLVDLSIQIGKPSRVDYMFTNCFSLSYLPLIDTSSCTHFENMMSNCQEAETIPDYDVSSAVTVQSMCKNMYKAKYGILEMYNKLLARGSAITNHTDCFKDCGRDTPQGRAALAQIPQSWGGLAEG